MASSKYIALSKALRCRACYTFERKQGVYSVCRLQAGAGSPTEATSPNTNQIRGLQPSSYKGSLNPF